MIHEMQIHLHEVLSILRNYINDIQIWLMQYVTTQHINALYAVLFSAGLSIVIIAMLYIMYSLYHKSRTKFMATISSNQYVIQQKDSLTDWINSLDSKMKKSGIKIKPKLYIVASLMFSIGAFIGSLLLFNNILAAILATMIFYAIPEYIFEMYSESQNRKIEDQLVLAIKYYTSESIQKKPMQKIFATIAQKVPLPTGKYFNDAYYNLTTGRTVNHALLELSGKFEIYHGKMFVQLIQQSQKNTAVLELLPDLMVNLETHIEMSRNNKTSLAGDRLQAFIMALLPIPVYLVMANIFPETEIFIRENVYGRIIITFSFLSSLGFVILDRQIGRVD